MRRFLKNHDPPNYWERKANYALLLLITVLFFLVTNPVAAKEDGRRYHFDIPSLSVQAALNQLAQQAGHQLLFSHKVVDLWYSSAIQGEYTVLEALMAILEDTGLSGSVTERGVIVICNACAYDKNASENENMGNKKELLAAAIATVVGGSGNAANAALAQEAGVAEEMGAAKSSLEEVLVTAQKREQNILEVPISVMALSGEELRARGLYNIDDLGLSVPGLGVVTSGDLERQISIRGVSNLFGSSNTVALYLDEVPLSGGRPQDQLDIKTYDLERVEVLRGPQGTLYGQGSMGGVIRFITKNPELTRTGFRADLSLSYTEGGDPSQRFQGVANIPLIEDELGFRIAAEYENAGGWMDQPALSKDGINERELYDVRAKGLWTPSDDLDVNLMVMVHRNDGSPNIGEDENGNFLQAFDLPTTPESEDDFEVYNLTINYDFGWASLVSATSYINGDKINTNTGRIIQQDAPPALPRDVMLLPQDREFDSLGQELRLSSTGSGPWQWTVGGFYQELDRSQFIGILAAFAPGPQPAPPLITISNESTSESWAVFVNASYDVTDKLEVGAGVRYFNDDQDVLNFPTTFGGFPISSEVRTDDSFDSIDPRFYASFAVNDDVTTYASIAKGFRSGGFNVNDLPSYDPEEIWSYELGVKASLLEGRLTAETALFFSDYTEYQTPGITNINGVPVNVTQNAGEAEVQGIEWGITWHATENLSLVFNGSYIDTEFTKMGQEDTDNIVGDRIPLVPRYLAALSANYDTEWGGRPGFVRLDYSQVGDSVVQLRSIGPWFQHNTEEITMLSLNIQWQWTDQISLGIFGDNLLNERDFLTPFDPLVGQASRPRPATYGIKIGVDI